MIIAFPAWVVQECIMLKVMLPDEVISIVLSHRHQCHLPQVLSDLITQFDLFLIFELPFLLLWCEYRFHQVDGFMLIKYCTSPFMLTCILIGSSLLILFIEIHSFCCWATSIIVWVVQVFLHYVNYRVLSRCWLIRRWCTMIALLSCRCPFKLTPCISIWVAWDPASWSILLYVTTWIINEQLFGRLFLFHGFSWLSLCIVLKEAGIKCVITLETVQAFKITFSSFFGVLFIIWKRWGAFLWWGRWWTMRRWPLKSY